ncbi:MAG: acyl-CoA dehydrogenase family protein [Ignavibacteriaceae bacterium]|nr:acyl-CoA dehydrogenase family protein [Ignavibacteriaceae bacterium]
MHKFNGIDYFNIESLLSEEEIMIRNSVRDFTSAEIIPIIEKANREGKFPEALITKMAELGLFGVTFPQMYNCAELNNVSYGLIMQELERGDSGVRSFVSVQSSLVMYPIFTFGTDEQKRQWLPLLAKGEKIGCFGLTEPDFGSNPGDLITKVEKVQDGYILNGTKMWITNGTIADICIVWAKSDGKIRGFIVEKGTKGFSAPEMKGKHSLRASVTSELIFDNVFIPESNLLPKTDGLKSALMCLNQARYGIAWGVVGSMMACYDAALNYAKTRIQFGKPIASYQLTQDKLVFMVTEITKAQLLNLQLGRLKDNGTLKHTQVSLAKRNNCEKASDIAKIAREILGANGILDEYPVMRHMANLESVRTYEGTHEMHTLIIGEDITGIPAFE